MVREKVAALGTCLWEVGDKEAMFGRAGAKEYPKFDHSVPDLLSGVDGAYYLLHAGVSYWSLQFVSTHIKCCAC